jgi:hypothetical protein
LDDVFRFVCITDDGAGDPVEKGGILADHFGEGRIKVLFRNGI